MCLTYSNSNHYPVREVCATYYSPLSCWPSCQSHTSNPWSSAKPLRYHSLREASPHVIEDREEGRSDGEIFGQFLDALADLISGALAPVDAWGDSSVVRHPAV